jgi:hypothetical protein
VGVSGHEVQHALAAGVLPESAHGLAADGGDAADTLRQTLCPDG